MKGICSLSIIPVRKEPNHRSELTTQILFGERFHIIDEQEKWTYVKLYYDDYEGWIDKKQITFITESEFNSVALQADTTTLDLVQIAVSGNNIFPILLGSSLPRFSKKKFFILSKEFQYEGQTRSSSKPDFGKLVENSFMYLHAPYLWGGRSPFGIDCSGFTQMAFKLSGLRIKRDASQQSAQGKRLDTFESSREGDLAFFKSEDNRIIHVGLILTNNRIIHASGMVRIDTIDSNGIFNESLKTYTHRLSHVSRFF